MKKKIKQNRKKKKNKNKNKNMLNKTKHKLDWRKIRKQNTQVMQTQKQERGEREKVTKSLGAFFLPHLERTFPFSKPLIRWKGGRIKTVQFERNIRALSKSLREAKEDGN